MWVCPTHDVISLEEQCIEKGASSGDVCLSGFGYKVLFFLCRKTSEKITLNVFFYYLP